MAWTAKSAGQIAHKAPVTVDTLDMLYDNPIAIANGDPGAPSVLPNVAVNTVAGSVGTYVFARKTSAGNVGFGTTASGGDLRPTSGFFGADQSGSISGDFTSAAALTGTWRCMGRSIEEEDLEAGGGVTLVRGATLWMRVT